VITFVSLFGLAYVAGALIVSAVSHALAVGAFCDTVRAHAIVPARLATPAALLVTLFEFSAGGAAALLAAQHRAPLVPVASVLTATTLVGAGFALYTRLLLRTSPGIGCGCSPLAAPTTQASLLPGIALVLVSGAGLAASVILTAAPSAATDIEGGLGLLPGLWGLTAGVAVMLLPAWIPFPARTEGPA
jgi:hypothetical protein